MLLPAAAARIFAGAVRGDREGSRTPRNLRSYKVPPPRSPVWRCLCAPAAPGHSIAWISCRTRSRPVRQGLKQNNKVGRRL